ncbi:HpcH/HpaI aldolase/citrate lyase family protein [Asanoa iriomotensis]|uniref:CoA ester lyase n=1 Tax=Asanoa iriomotensis TaxID=234613 RepID=A0ABQ4BZ75_9ACTN|nr:CoA ester lyase [Asanoa iriomotensis]GIF55824.1 CoA ester lyase [Asanoa iriomotensis]
MTVRSFLYVPGDQPAKLDKSLSCGADAVIVDLEDAVGPHRKAAARECVAGWLARSAPHDIEIWVRVNAGAHRPADLALVREAPNVAGVCLAKCDSADDVRQVAELFAGRDVGLMPLIESAAGVLRAEEIARVRGVRLLQLGEVDLAADLGLRPSDGDELDAYRAQIVLVSAAARLRPPPAPVDVHLADDDLFRRSTQRLRRRGFWGRACVHPRQVAIANEVFTPTDAELAEARDVLARLERSGDGVTVDGQGRMVDEAVALRARRLLG